MKKPASERPGSIKSFFDNYKALAIIFLVFLTATVHGQSQPDTSARQLINGNGFTWKNGEFKGAFIPPRDTFKLSIRDTGSIAYKNGAFYQWNVNRICSCLKWDTLQARGTGGSSSFDSTNTQFLAYLANHPYKLIAASPLTVNVGLSGHPDTLACPTCGTGGSALSNWVTSIDSLKTIRPTTNGVVYHTSYHDITDNVNSGAQYVWSSASTATGNDHDVIMPTVGSGAGRFILIPIGGNITTAQYGILPGSTDRANINTFNQWAAGNKYAGYLSPGTWTIDTTALLPYNNLKFYGFGASSILLEKAHTNKAKSILFYYSTTDSIHNIEVAFLNFQGNTIYTNGAIDGASPVIDSTSSAISVRFCDSVNIHDNIFGNGFNLYSIYYTYCSHVNIVNNSGDHIGTAIAGSSYDPNSRYINVLRNKLHWFGLYNVYDPEDTSSAPRRNGSSFAEGGGADYLAEGNEGWNEAQTICLFHEGKYSGAATVKNNIYHAMGRLTGGYSEGGALDQLIKCPSLTVTGNKTDSCYFTGYRHKDSSGSKRLFISGQAYNEFTYSLIVEVTGNTLPNHSYSYRQCNAVNWHNEILDNRQMNVGNYSGSGILMTAGLTNVNGVDTSNITMDNIYATIGSGQVYNYQLNGSLAYVTIKNSTFIFLGDYKVGEMSQPGTTNMHKLSFLNNKVIGNITGGGKAFYQYSTTPKPAPVVDISGTDLSKTNIDSSQTSGNFKDDFIGSGGLVSTFIEKQTKFFTGTISDYPDSIGLSGSNLQIGFNGKIIKQTIALPGGGGAGVAQKTGIIINSGTKDSIRVDTSYMDSRYQHIFDVVKFGGVADGKRLTNVAMSSGTATVTSTGAGFSSLDIGKAIRVIGSGSAGIDQVGTILAVGSSTSITVSFTAATTVSADTVNYGTDNTAAITAAGYAAKAAGGGVVYFRNGAGTYIVSGSLITSLNGVNPNCVIPIPEASLGGAVTRNFNERTTITYEGETTPTFTPSSRSVDSLTSHNGAVILCLTQGSGMAPAVFGTKGSGGGGTLSFVNAAFKNLQIYVPRNIGGGGPNIGGINCYYSASSSFENILVGIDGSFVNSGPRSNEVAGIITNQTGSETMTFIKNSAVAGFKYGWVTSDHAWGDNEQAYKCTYAFTYPISAYNGGGPKLVAHWCDHQVYVPKSTILGYIPPGLAYLNIGDLEIEPLTAGNNSGYVDAVNDSANNGIGEVKIQWLQGHNSDFIRYGGANIIATQLGTFGNKVTNTTTDFKLGDSATAILNFVPQVQTTGSYNNIFKVNNTSIFDETKDLGALFSGTPNVNSGREDYWYDYISGKFVMYYDNTDRFVVGQGLNSYGLRVEQPTGSVKAISAFSDGSVSLGQDSLKDPSSILTINSTGKGILIPRLTTTGMNAISGPAPGLLIWNKTDSCLYHYTGIGWAKVGSGGSGGFTLTTTGTSGAATYSANVLNIPQYSGGGGGTPGGSTTQVQYNNAGSFAGSSNLVWDNTNARLGIGGTPSAPLHIIAPSASGFGQFSIQASTGTAGTSLAYMSWRDGAGTRMMVEGFGQYGGSPDLNYYYANEINGSFVWRNSAAQIAELTTGGNLGLGRTPTLAIDVLRNANAGAVVQVENTNTGSSAYSAFNAKTNAGTLQGAMQTSAASGFGAVAAGGGYLYSTATGGLALLSDGPLQFGTSTNLRAALSTAGVFRLHAYTAPNVVLDTTNYKPLVVASDGTVLESSWQAASGGGTGANPTAAIGLTAVNGSAPTYMRSDAAPPIDSAAIFSGMAGRAVIFTGSTDYTISKGVSLLCYSYTSGGTNRNITLPDPSAVPNREIRLSLAGTSINVTFLTTSGTATFFTGTVSIGTSCPTNTSGLFTFKSDGTNWILVITN